MQGSAVSEPRLPSPDAYRLPAPVISLIARVSISIDDAQVRVVLRAER